LELKESPAKLQLPARISRFCQYCFYGFLEQVNDLLNDVTMFGNMSNFVGTININDPFSNKLPCADGLIDEVHDVKWYHDMIKICDVEAKGEQYMLLPVIGYITKQELILIRYINWI